MLRKIYSIFIASIIIMCSCGMGYANDFASEHITLKNNEEATVKKGHPVIIVTNNIDRDLSVTYDFYYDEESQHSMSKEVYIPANQSITIEIPELKILGKTGEIRRVWFSWNERNVRKPLNTQIDTYPFKYEEISQPELG